jgi:hypothetical protein
MAAHWVPAHVRAMTVAQIYATFNLGKFAHVVLAHDGL